MNMQFELISTLNLVKNSVLYILSLSIMTLVPLLISIAFFTLAERKVMASIQRRRGPNVVGM
jgi:NADH:ubiquinone oxidoreductase subunit H